MLGLPGGAYLYQGEELGLPDGTDIPDHQRQDPTFVRTGGERLGRGCRVPLPWRASEKHNGFGPGQDPWLPQPASFLELARDVQSGDPSSHLNLYRRMLGLRRELGLGRGSLSWAEELCSSSSLAFLNGNILVVMNIGQDTIELPAGEVLLPSTGGVTAPEDVRYRLRSGEAAWLRVSVLDTGS